ncbi:RecX family transcriptional regulator [Glaciihabitans sp. UYNi722]|uniref:regulatory protein RecX n=1 Tax=Glaciihabitans sp. UYNi722 TaxID=3156344 RepID=UPI003393859E
MGTGDGLARVTYLPGVMPPPSPDQSASVGPDSVGPDLVGPDSVGPDLVGPDSVGPEDVEREAVEQIEPSAALPDFESFFGEDAEAETSVGAEPEEETKIRSNRREVRAENVSMHALTRRGMSRWELEKTLLSRELDEETVAAELERLEGVGLIDDGSLAETLVRTQHERKGLGRGALTAELRRRHIDQEHIDAALEQIDVDDEQSRATELAVKRAGQLSSYDLETAKRRLNGFLMRKGYSSTVVRTAVDEALASRSGAGRSGGVRFQ